ncbi:MAG: PAS domain-containing protein [Anaerolineae bacterium]|nr:PAS domain-containing protein [Anaerolineae bacterium]
MPPNCQGLLLGDLELFDRVPLGIVVLGRDLRIRRLNPAWATFAEHYGSLLADQVVPGLSFFDVFPGTETSVKPIFEQVLAGETVRQESFRLEIDGVVSYWDAVLVPLFIDGEIAGILQVCMDATERKQAQKSLRESEANLRSLLENARGFGVYQVAVDPGNPYQGKVILASPSIREMLGIEDPYRFESWFENVHPDDLPRIVEANRRSLERGEPFDQSGRFYNAQMQQWMWFRTISNPVFDDGGNLTHFNGLIIDVTEQKQAEETLQAYYRTLEQRGEERTRETERRRRVAAGLRDILATLNSEQPREEILKHIVSQANHLLDSDACLIYRLEQDNQWMVMESEYGLPPDYKALRAGPIYPTAIARATLSRKPAAIADLSAYVMSKMAEDEGLTEFHRRWFEIAAKHFCSAMDVPLIVKDALYGGMVFYYREQREFSEEEFRLGIMLGDQAALAIENARLRVQAELIAVVKERERLARELHDSVTQSLYSVTLLSEAGRQLAEAGDLTRIGGYLERLGEISQQALREMRLLVYELRPLVLRREGLAGALQQRLDAVEKRAGVDARLLVEGEVELPAPVEEALYRIAQEALNNTLKHAGASNVTVCVRSRDDRVELEVIDDGGGFDLGAAGKDGGLGLTSMRERAEKVGGVLDITSALGEGTRVKACVGTNRESQAVPRV